MKDIGQRSKCLPLSCLQDRINNNCLLSDTVSQQVSVCRRLGFKELTVEEWRASSQSIDNIVHPVDHTRGLSVRKARGLGMDLGLLLSQTIGDALVKCQVKCSHKFLSQCVLCVLKFTCSVRGIHGACTTTGLAQQSSWQGRSIQSALKLAVGQQRLPGKGQRRVVVGVFRSGRIERYVFNAIRKQLRQLIQAQGATMVSSNVLRNIIFKLVIYRQLNIQRTYQLSPSVSLLKTTTDLIPLSAKFLARSSEMLPSMTTD